MRSPADSGVSGCDALLGRNGLLRGFLRLLKNDEILRRYPLASPVPVGPPYRLAVSHEIGVNPRPLFLCEAEGVCGCVGQFAAPEPGITINGSGNVTVSPSGTMLSVSH